MGKAQVKDNADDKDSFVDELKPGTKLMHGQYTIENFLNAGGFGITYLAKDSLDRKIVIKECFPGAFCRRSRYIVQARSRAHQNELKSIVRLFVQEARSLAKLDHPNIVGVHQVFEDNETAYMALDFVEGRDLLDTIEDPNHGLTPAQIKSILKEILGAVGFIHDQGILHRDISPDNILINSDFHPVLIDFGAAREEATKQSRVLSALRVVKDGYSPQEFYIAGSEQSPSSDLYALAASFHHLIAKDVPPNSQARLAAIASGEADPYVPLIGRFPDYDDDFLASIDKALAVLPKDRLQSAKAWIDMMDGNTDNVTALNVAGAAPVAAVAADEGTQTRSKMPMLLGSAAAVALLIGVGAFVATGNDTPEATPVAAAPEVSTAVPEAPANVEVETAAVAPVETVTTPEVTTPVTTAPEAPTVTTDDAAVAPVEEAAAPVTEPVVEAPAEEAPAAETPEPVGPVVITTDTGTDAAEEAPNGPVIVSGTEAATLPVPAVRPAVRPESVEIAAAPVIEAPAPLPEPVATPRPETDALEGTRDLPSQTANRPVADGATPAVALPSTPSTVSAVGPGPEAQEIVAVKPGNELPPASVETQWTVQLPFEADAAGSNVIGQVGAISPVWVKPGLVVTSVNGTPVDAISQIPSVLRNATDIGEADQIEVAFGTLDPATSESVDQPWILPVVQQTELRNGVKFQTSYTGTEWRTVVTDAPESGAGELKVGDVLVSYIPTGQDFVSRDAIATIVESELEKGTKQFIFSVRRGESTWVAPMNYTGDEE
ncbi:protein kinase [Yoonia sp. SS1-5]|uniref:Protein kinase n=1 Tax=Yoonia rhodophyticola TaxID=3137370 RepID=A0AAN0NL63_9RHOB